VFNPEDGATQRSSRHPAAFAGRYSYGAYGKRTLWGTLFVRGEVKGGGGGGGGGGGKENNEELHVIIYKVVK
jgi:hypothetical protein